MALKDPEWILSSVDLNKLMSLVTASSRWQGHYTTVSSETYVIDVKIFL